MPAGNSRGSARSSRRRAKPPRGSAITAASSLAGGSSADEIAKMKQQAANYQAAQLRENAAGEIAAAQRQAYDVGQKTNMLRSCAVADAAASGINAGAGSAVTNQSGIVQRGQYLSQMDLWNGQNRATGLLNQAQGVEYTGYMDTLAGEEAKRAADLSALPHCASLPSACQCIHWPVRCSVSTTCRKQYATATFREYYWLQRDLSRAYARGEL